jgi:hypothetical protein
MERQNRGVPVSLLTMNELTDGVLTQHMAGIVPFGKLQLILRGRKPTLVELNLVGCVVS